jgi:hypothetical protein
MATSNIITNSNNPMSTAIRPPNTPIGNDGGGLDTLWCILSMFEVQGEQEGEGVVMTTTMVEEEEEEQH